MQGDVTWLLDSSRNEVVNYTYDTWGKLLSIGGSLASTVGVENPMRYRGYYYDTETGLYYLQSRYYYPEWGRFISKDDPSYQECMTGAAANLYSYGNNNPVNMIDPTGHFGTPLSWAMAVIFGIVGGVVGYYIAQRNHWNWWQTGLFMAACAAGGAVLGFMAGEVLVGFIRAFLSVNPIWFTKLPSAVLWLIGYGGASAAVIGSYPGYVNLAQNIGASFFQVSTQVWNSLSSSEQWALNREFLDDMIAQNNNFICSTNASSAKVGTWFYQEIQYLLSNGYVIIDNGYKLVKK